jgi:hypothetical protein
MYLDLLMPIPIKLRFVTIQCKSSRWLSLTYKSKIGKHKCREKKMPNSMPSKI